MSHEAAEADAQEKVTAWRSPTPSEPEPEPEPAPEVEIPELEGLHPDDAISELHDLGLEAELIENVERSWGVGGEFDDTTEVYATDPRSGATATSDDDDVILCVTNSGARTYQEPDEAACQSFVPHKDRPENLFTIEVKQEFENEGPWISVEFDGKDLGVIEQTVRQAQEDTVLALEYAYTEYSNASLITVIGLFPGTDAYGNEHDAKAALHT